MHSPQRMLLFLILIIFLLAFVQLNVISIAFDKLGLSPESASLLLITTLLGSLINLPLFGVNVEKITPGPLPFLWRALGLARPHSTGKTMLAVNVGGCVIPVAFSGYLLTQYSIDTVHVFLAIGVVTAVSYAVSRPIQGIGIAMPIFVAPITAALAAVILNPEQSAPLAYIGGTMGVLIGADVLRLNGIKKMAPPFASIGGAGTFDGIFVTGIVAVLLA